MFESLYEYFQRGGVIMWPLLLCSIVAVAVALERMVVFLWTGTSFGSFQMGLQRMLQQDGAASTRESLQADRSPYARVARVYLQHEQNSAASRQEIVATEASYQLTRLETRLHWLSVIGSLAPMIGLLGTVWGLVEAFHQIEVLGGQVQPSDLAAGIWQALLTTVFGLVVALPSLAVYHFLEQYVGAVQLRMQWLVASLNQWLGHDPASTPPSTLPQVQSEVATDVVVSAGE